MVEQEYTTDSKSVAARIEGSIPSSRTIKNYNYAEVQGSRPEAELRGQEELRKDALLTRFGIDHPVKSLHKRECAASKY